MWPHSRYNCNWMKQVQNTATILYMVRRSGWCAVSEVVDRWIVAYSGHLTCHIGYRRTSHMLSSVVRALSQVVSWTEFGSRSDTFLSSPAVVLLYHFSAGYAFWRAAQELVGGLLQCPTQAQAYVHINNTCLRMYYGLCSTCCCGIRGAKKR